MGKDWYLQQRLNRIDGVGEYLKQHIIPTAQLMGVNEFYLEIGCGHGHWLHSFASHEPSKLFVGIDLISKRVLKANSKKSLSNLKNLYFLKAEASELLDAIKGKLEVASTFVMFPDPWPKKRHFKNRLIQNEFLFQLAKTSASHSSLFFRTDHPGYFEWTLTHINQNKLWNLKNDSWPHEAASFFQNLFDQSFTCSGTKL